MTTARRVAVVCAAVAGLIAVSLAFVAPFSRAAPIAEQSPAGANDWSCRPSPAHPNPVVLVHGLGATMAANWPYLSPLLAADGYCVFALTYGVDARAPFPLDQIGGVAPMERSAEELAAFVGRVLAATGADKVDIVGHSEGSLMPNYFVKFLGGGAVVDKYVGLTPVWHGTEFFGLAALYRAGSGTGLSELGASLTEAFCGSCTQFLAGSPFLQAMHEGGAAVPGITYTMIMTKLDLLVVPYTNGILHAPNATNIVLQDVCPLDLADHLAVAFDSVTAQLVRNALDPANARAPQCELVLPLIGRPTR